MRVDGNNAVLDCSPQKILCVEVEIAVVALKRRSLLDLINIPAEHVRGDHDHCFNRAL